MKYETWECSTFNRPLADKRDKMHMESDPEYIICKRQNKKYTHNISIISQNLSPPPTTTTHIISQIFNKDPWISIYFNHPHLTFTPIL